MLKKISIVWFKRDLRIHDHAPLAAAVFGGLPVLPIYVVEPDYWRQPFAARRHWHFIHDCLTELRVDLKNLGQPLTVRIGQVTEIFEGIFNQFKIEAIYAHEETSNYWGYERDKKVRLWCQNKAVNFFYSFYPRGNNHKEINEYHYNDIGTFLSYSFYFEIWSNPLLDSYGDKGLIKVGNTYLDND